MPIRTAQATWTGNLLQGTGQLSLGSNSFSAPYSFGTRFQDQPGTNPEELLGAAHAACFSMALSAGLSKAGHTPNRIHTIAQVTIEKVGEGFKITRILLTTEASVPSLDGPTFQQFAQQTKTACPVSQALAATDIQLTAKLIP